MPIFPKIGNKIFGREPRFLREGKTPPYTSVHMTALSRLYYLKYILSNLVFLAIGIIFLNSAIIVMSAAAFPLLLFLQSIKGFMTATEHSKASTPAIMTSTVWSIILSTILLAMGVTNLVLTGLIGVPLFIPLLVFFASAGLVDFYLSGVVLQWIPDDELYKAEKGSDAEKRGRFWKYTGLVILAELALTVFVISFFIPTIVMPVMLFSSAAIFLSGLSRLYLSGKAKESGLWFPRTFVSNAFITLFIGLGLLFIANPIVTIIALSTVALSSVWLVYKRVLEPLCSNMRAEAPSDETELPAKYPSNPIIRKLYYGVISLVVAISIMTPLLPLAVQLPVLFAMLGVALFGVSMLAVKSGHWKLYYDAAVRKYNTKLSDDAPPAEKSTLEKLKHALDVTTNIFFSTCSHFGFAALIIGAVLLSIGGVAAIPFIVLPIMALSSAWLLWRHVLLQLEQDKYINGKAYFILEGDVVLDDGIIKSINNKLSENGAEPSGKLRKFLYNFINPRNNIYYLIFLLGTMTMILTPLLPTAVQLTVLLPAAAFSFVMMMRMIFMAEKIGKSSWYLVRLIQMFSMSSSIVLAMFGVGLLLMTGPTWIGLAGFICLSISGGYLMHDVIAEELRYHRLASFSVDGRLKTKRFYSRSLVLGLSVALLIAVPLMFPMYLQLLGFMTAGSWVLALLIRFFIESRGWDDIHDKVYEKVRPAKAKKGFNVAWSLFYYILKLVGSKSAVIIALGISAILSGFWWGMGAVAVGCGYLFYERFEWFFKLNVSERMGSRLIWNSESGKFKLEPIFISIGIAFIVATSMFPISGHLFSYIVSSILIASSASKMFNNTRYWAGVIKTKKGTSSIISVLDWLLSSIGSIGFVALSAGIVMMLSIPSMYLLGLTLTVFGTGYFIQDRVISFLARGKERVAKDWIYRVDFQMFSRNLGFGMLLAGGAYLLVTLIAPLAFGVMFAGTLFGAQLMEVAVCMAAIGTMLWTFGIVPLARDMLDSSVKGKGLSDMLAEAKPDSDMDWTFSEGAVTDSPMMPPVDPAHSADRLVDSEPGPRDVVVATPE